MIPTSKLIFIILFGLHASGAIAQDPQLSQYYNAPLFLNPALAGTANNSRGVLNYRLQWTSLPSPYQTIAASFDHNIEPYNSGVGLLIKRDRQGDGGLTSTDVSAIYSYRVYLGEKLGFIPAIQAGFVTRDINFFNLTFGDQLTSNGNTGLPSGDNFTPGPSRSFLDFSAGGLLYSEAFWIGVSTQHLNRPNQAFVGESRLPRKMSIHGGYKIHLTEPARETMYGEASKERSLTPTFMYKMQGRYDQFDLGLYMIYEPIMFGMWYRGVPVKKYNEGLNNNESLILLAGVYYKGLTLSYSYDFTISAFKPGSGGSHEIAVIYGWEIPYNNYKKKKRRRKVSCPNFDK